MKKIVVLLQVVMICLLVNTNQVYAEENKKVTHVVMVWLKRPGNIADRNAFVKASEKLNDLPGIVSRHVGIVKMSDRAVVDDSFDVAVTMTMKNQAALKAYLDSPKHQRILKEEIKPLTDRVVIYDFISQ